MAQTKDIQRMNVQIDSAVRTVTVQVPSQPDVVLHLDRLHQDNKSYAALYGIGVRITRAAALSAGADGKSAPWSEKRAALQALVEHLESGSPEWSPARQSGSRIGSDEVLLAQALAEAFPEKTPERIREYLHGLTKAQRASVAATGKVKEILERMRAEQTKDIDGEELLAGL